MRHILYLLLLLSSLSAAWGQTTINATVQIHSGGNMVEFNSLTFVSGYVVTPRNEPTANLIFQPGTSHGGSSNGSHVDGYVQKNGNTAFTFPVGSGTKLRPAGISAPGSASAVFRAAYFATNPTSAILPVGGPFSTSLKAASLSAVSSVEYWDMDGASAINLTLTWDAASSLATLTGNTLANLVIVGWNGTQWVSLGAAGGTTGTLSGTGTITATGVVPDTYRAFTFGVGQELCNNGIDDDGDGLVDCADPDCKAVTLAAITGPATACGFTPQTYTTTAVAGISYTWTVPSGWILTAGQGTNSITVTTSGSTGDVCVTGTQPTGCVTNPPCKPVTITGPPPAPTFKK